MAAGNYEFSISVSITAKPSKVWAALTQEIGEWWPAHFFSGEGAKKFVVESKLGGRLYEDWGLKTGCMWGTVVVWLPPKENDLGLRNVSVVWWARPIIYHLHGRRVEKYIIRHVA